MANVCVIRHQSYIKSQTHLPYRHNMRTLKHYSNENIDLFLTKFNSIIENNLNKGESYLTAFNRLHRNGAFTGQLKVQGDELKQTKYLDEFLVYPPYEKIKEMSFSEQDEFFRKEMKAINNYFPDVIILSAVVHRDEVFLPMDEDMKSLFPEGKITPHMHLTVIPIKHDKKTNSKKISISELWKGKNSYRKFQDYMYQSVGKVYGFDRGEIHDLDESKKHLNVEAYKLQETSKSLKKLESEIVQKEHELAVRAKNLEPEEHISIFNLRSQMEQQKLSETEKHLSEEMERNNDFLNIKISNNELRSEMITQAKKKIRLFDFLMQTIMKYLPELINKCPSFIRDLVTQGIISDKDISTERKQNTRQDR